MSIKQYQIMKPTHTHRYFVFFIKKQSGNFTNIFLFSYTYLKNAGVGVPRG